MSSSDQTRENRLAIGVGLGLPFGVTFGILFDNLALGIALGLVGGVCYGFMNWSGKSKDNDDEDFHHKNDKGPSADHDPGRSS